MEQDYLTIKEAMAYAGTSESSLRRWIRSLRSQYQIERTDTNEALEVKTPLLRKRNEVLPDGAIRMGKHGLPVFDWLLLKTAIDELFLSDNGQPQGDNSPDSGQLDFDNGRDPSPQSGDSNQELNDNPSQPEPDSGRDDSQQTGDGSRDNGQQTGDGSQEEYLWVNRQVFENLIAQLDKKDVQIERKDSQLDEVIERNREANILLKNYQENYGLLAAPKREDEKAEAGKQSD